MKKILLITSSLTLGLLIVLKLSNKTHFSEVDDTGYTSPLARLSNSTSEKPIHGQTFSYKISNPSGLDKQSQQVTVNYINKAFLNIIYGQNEVESINYLKSALKSHDQVVKATAEQNVWSLIFKISRDQNFQTSDESMTLLKNLFVDFKKLNPEVLLHEQKRWPKSKSIQYLNTLRG